MSTKLKHIVLAMSLGGAMLTLGACAHEQFHHDLSVAHREFHAQPYTAGEHRRFLEELEDLHRDYHDRDYYRNYY
jgi:hypothetical protein